MSTQESKEKTVTEEDVKKNEEVRKEKEEEEVTPPIRQVSHSWNEIAFIPPSR